MNHGQYVESFSNYLKVNRCIKRIHREELTKVLNVHTDQELYNAVNELIVFGHLEKPKPNSRIKTNGNVMYPVYDSYRVLSSEEGIDRTTVEEILQDLHPALCANGYIVEHPQEFRKYKAETKQVSDYLFKHPDLKQRVILSRRERSYRIFQDEKLMERGKGGSRLGSEFVTYLHNIGATGELLHYYDETDDNFRAYIREGREDQEITLIVCENKDIWDHLGRLIMQAATAQQRTFFNVLLDGAICSWGNSAAKSRKLTQWYNTFMNGRKIHFLYYGDIDREGIRIYGKIKAGNPDIDIRPCIPFYNQAMDLLEAENIIPRPSNDHRNLPENSYTEILFQEFEEDTALRMMKYLRPNLMIPQEIINNEVLQNEIVRNHERSQEWQSVPMI